MTTAAERYREQLKRSQVDVEIVDVTLPSGAVFRMRKPSKFAMLFNLGGLPTSGIASAMAKWEKDGAKDDPETATKVFEDMPEDEQAKLVSVMMRARDRVLELSVEPKLVVGTADEAKGEMSTDDVAENDLAYLFNWVIKGGEIPSGIVMFPGGSGSGAVAKPNRTQRRAANKRAGGNRG